MQTFSTEYTATGHYDGDYDEAALQRWVIALRSRLSAPRVSLGLVFLSPRFTPHAAGVLEIVRLSARVSLLAGCSGMSLIVGSQELEENPGLVVGLYALPGARLTGVRLTQAQVETANDGTFWQTTTGVAAGTCGGWLAFADPFTFDGEAWLRTWNTAYEGIPTMGGLASGDPGEKRTQVYLGGEVYSDGAVAVAVGGEVRLAGVVSQGCTPIGQPWTITRAEGNLIHRIGNRPAYAVLAETYSGLPKEQQQRAQGNLFLGLVTNEYQEEFQRGDFLIRNLIGGDPSSGVLAVGAQPRAGQSIQFQCRDPSAATEDMMLLLDRSWKQLKDDPIYGGCLCSCSGRGARLFGVANHDASLAQRQFGPFGLSGFFGNGELGPVGRRNYLHGYTASLALFTKVTPSTALNGTSSSSPRQ